MDYNSTYWTIDLDEGAAQEIRKCTNTQLKKLSNEIKGYIEGNSIYFSDNNTITRIGRNSNYASIHTKQGRFDLVPDGYIKLIIKSSSDSINPYDDFSDYIYNNKESK